MSERTIRPPGLFFIQLWYKVFTIPAINYRYSRRSPSSLFKMTDRVRQMMKKSTSKLSTSKGSVNHIGTTPYRFRIDIFVSYAENIKNMPDACITCERRGKVYATESVSVKDGKAVFRQALSMECTLFRKNTSSKAKHEKTPPSPTEQLEFDEKKAKIFLRKGGAQGKAVAKLSLNLSEYVKGASSTVFADMKLSDGTLVVTKVESTMLAMDKKKKGSRHGSELASEMSDANSVDDSLFGDDDDLQHAQHAMDMATEPERMSSIGTSVVQPNATGMPSSVSPITPRRPSNGRNEKAHNVPSETFSSPSSPPILSKDVNLVGKGGQILDTDGSGKRKTEETTSAGEGSSTKDKIKFKIKGLHSKKGKDDGEDSVLSRSSVCDGSLISEQGSDFNEGGVKPAEVKELKRAVEALKKENAKLKKARNAAIEEVEALQTELKTCELSMEERDREGSTSQSAVEVKTASLRAEIKEKNKEIKELKTKNSQLMDELEEQHQEMRNIAKKLKEKDKESAKKKDETAEDVQKKSRSTAASEEQLSKIVSLESEVITLQKRIKELEVALEREPTFMDVVNELKVIKVTLALANMEKEQALFQLQSYRTTSNHVHSSEIAITQLLSDNA